MRVMHEEQHDGDKKKLLLLLRAKPPDLLSNHVPLHPLCCCCKHPCSYPITLLIRSHRHKPSAVESFINDGT